MSSAFDHILACTRWRIRAQRGLDGSVSAAVCSGCAAALVLYLGRLGVVPAPILPFAFACAAAAVVSWAALGLLREVSIVLAASRLDQAYAFHDRLVSTVEFAGHPTPNAFMKAHIEETVSLVRGLDPARAVPIRAPRRVPWLCAPVLGLLLAAWLPTDQSGGAMLSAGPRKARPLSPLVVESVDLDAQRRRARALTDEIGPDSAWDLGDAARQLEALLGKVHAREISRAETVARLARLEEQLEAAATPQLKSIESRLRELGRVLRRQRGTRALGQALEEGALRAAAREAARLGHDGARLGRDERRRLARGLARAAQHVGARPPSPSARQLERLNQQRHRPRPDARQLERLEQELSAAAVALRGDTDPALRRAFDALAQRFLKLARSARQRRTHERLREQLRELKDWLQHPSPFDASHRRKLESFQLRARGVARAGDDPPRREAPRVDPPSERSPEGLMVGRTASELEGRGPALASLRRSSDAPGGGPDPSPLGDSRRLRGASARAIDVPGLPAEGPTQSEVIEAAAAREGFATRGYRGLYRRYHAASKDHVEREDIPMSRRRLVKRYFDLIRPAEL